MERLRADVCSLKDALRRSRDFATDTARCRIYARAFLWSPLFTRYGSLTEYANWCKEFGCNAPAHAFRPAMEV